MSQLSFSAEQLAVIASDYNQRLLEHSPLDRFGPLFHKVIEISNLCIVDLLTTGEDLVPRIKQSACLFWQLGILEHVESVVVCGGKGTTLMIRNG
ncbi:hypothetical protein AMR74_13355 [Halorubrum tropicale]|uniref:Uncharacterized protein n=1 Tax=Halorubrum tropicale TaxID=1765655 RepID=A0A0M9AP43_9EURY|nr:hypothetical protein AMR74_13355 [Halorubrum tropicale]